MELKDIITGVIIPIISAVIGGIVGGNIVIKSENQKQTNKNTKLAIQTKELNIK